MADLSKPAAFLRAMSGFAASIGVLFCLMAVGVRADILISPHRVVLSDEVRQAVVNLHNPGTVERIYRLEWVERRQLPNGDLVHLKAGENPRSAAGLVRFSPRQVTVPPGQTQTIRLDYRPARDMAPGEYRSHLRIQQLPREGVAVEVARGEQEGIQFRLDALLSFSIPVFVRHGPGAARVEIVSVQPEWVKTESDAVPALRVGLVRTGEFGSFGRIAVYQQMAPGAPVVEIGHAASVAIYAETNRLDRVVELRRDAELRPGSWLRVTFEGEGPERGQVLAEQVVQIGR